MRRRTALGLVALSVPLAIAGCGVLGGNSTMVPNTTQTASTGPVSGAGWLVSASGSPTPSPTPSYAGSRSPALPPVSFLPPPDPACATSWMPDPVLIPMTVVPTAGGFTVSWPRQRASDYRITAVAQPLVTGKQPEYTWQPVPATSSCTVTASITGLKKGTPYVIWLDAPNTGYERDGARHPYSGRSGVVYPL